MSNTNDTDFGGTPFNSRTAPLNFRVRWSAWDKYHMADEFNGLDEEMRALRNDVVVLDMSPLTKLNISGPDAAKFTNYLITRDVSKMEVNQIYFTPWCDHNGNVISDGMVFRMGENQFRFTGDPSEAWFNHIRKDYDVEITDVTHERAILSLQGPKSIEVLEAATGKDWSDFKFSRIRIEKIGGVDVEVARQGFTGERGYELCVASKDAVAMWDAVMEAGQPFGLQAAGYVVVDRARIEAGLIIPGPDYTNGGLAEDETGAPIPVDEENQSSPFELRLGKFVDFDKGDFCGRDALLKEKEAGGAKKKMVGLVFDWRAISDAFIDQDLAPVVVPNTIWMPLPVNKGGSKIGRATSVTWSPTLEKLIGFGFLEKTHAEVGATVSAEFDVNGNVVQVNAEVVKLPFLELQRAK